MKCTVYRITGSIPAGNYIQFPRTSTQSLSLTGQYLYVLFKPISGKYFVAHIDVATEDGLAIRISFSNLFKEFKSTSTWLQFPFVPRPPPGSLDEAILASSTSHGMIGTLFDSSWCVARCNITYCFHHHCLHHHDIDFSIIIRVHVAFHWSRYVIFWGALGIVSSWIIQQDDGKNALKSGIRSDIYYYQDGRCHCFSQTCSLVCPHLKT